MTYSIAEITCMLNISGFENDRRPISILLTDSRSLTDASQSLFFALSTPTNDGHNYITDLYRHGVRAFVVTHIPDGTATTMPDAAFIVVPDVTVALQTIAKAHRMQFKAPVIGITGSAGKTTVKEWLYSILGSSSLVDRSPRSYNSQIGVPLSVWNISDKADYAIIEAGISRSGEMSALRSIIKPDIGIITGIGHEHDEGFESLDCKCREKLSLFTGCHTVIFNADDQLIHDNVSTVCHNATLVSCSRHDASCTLFVEQTLCHDSSTAIVYNFRGQQFTAELPFTSAALINDAILCIAAAHTLRIDHESLKAALPHLTPVDTRLNVVEGVNNTMLVYDSFTNDASSLVPALDFIQRRLTPGRSTTVIISDFQPSVGSSDVYNSVARLLNTYDIRRFIGIGHGFLQHASLFPSGTEFHTSVAEFMTSASTGDFTDELILIKGTPESGIHAVAELLEAKHHETVLEVNLDAIVHNFNHFRAMLRPGTGIVAMVKASGYGAGSYELAKTLQAQGAAYLAVAVLDEGVELRRAGITMPIMVLNPKVVNYSSLFSCKLEPEIFTFEMLDEIVREAGKRGITDYPVHIKFDTGMHRLGFLESDIPALASRLNAQHAVSVRSAFSHLATADCLDQDDYTLQQLECFDRCTTQLRQQLHGRPFLRHILNSAGIARFPQYQYNMVRLGICLYGISTMPIPAMQGLRRVSSLHTIIISIKEWEAGTTIGYSRRGVLSRHSRIATIPVGYADGLDRHLGCGRASVWINGHRCPTVGNICMDACMIDVTDAPCAVGDVVEIFGEHITVDELAETLGTIPYEILTSVSTRVKRVYYRE